MMSSQQYGQAAPPSNMMFPTAAYLQASQNAAEMQMRGQEALGRGIAGGIGAVTDAYKQYKDDQAKFDATKKLFKAFSGSLDEETKNSIQDIFNDTSISTREKNAISPAIMQYLGNVQQQKGREQIANIMTESREAIAAAKNKPRQEPIVFNATSTGDPLDQVVGQTPAAPAPAVPHMIQRPQGQPQPTQGPLSNMPKTRQDPKTSRMQFWSPGAKRYVDESENELFFGPDLRIAPF